MNKIMNTFYDEINKYSWEKIKNDIYSKTEQDVKKALIKENCSIEDFKALISPAAETFLEEMAFKSHLKTQKRFGKTIQLYIPLYLSNKCTNSCVYCGFNKTLNYKRITLNEEEILKEALAIKNMGFRHILLVTGEHPECGFEYIKNAIKLIKNHFSLISIEVAPFEKWQYEELISEGLHTVYVYQETYNIEKYKQYHPAGKKANFRYRLETPDRIGSAGIYRIGLGCLLGLEDWRVDTFFTALHIDYLKKKYWKTRYSVSFPRLRPNAGNFQPPYQISDKELVQIICAYRLYDENLEMTLSTRESSKFRDHAIKIGITSMSAGSKTYPGGYSLYPEQLEQFEVGDNRTPSEIINIIKKQGYEPIWKDWDNIIISNKINELC